MDILSYIMDNKLILIPVIYIISYILKETMIVREKFISLILLALGIILSVLMGGDSIVNNIVQGILVTGTTVLAENIVMETKNNGT